VSFLQSLHLAAGSYKLTTVYTFLAMRSEPSLTKIEDPPESPTSRSVSAIRPHLNRTKPEEEDNVLPASSPLEGAEDNRISLPPSQDRESSTGSPVPSIPTTDSPLSLQRNSYFESLTESGRSTPVSTATGLRGVRKPFLRQGFRHRVHPLKHQVSQLYTKLVELLKIGVFARVYSMTWRKRQNSPQQSGG
jgi:hypothetical protein